MTQLFNFPLDVDFAGTYLQANGMEGPGNTMLTGMSDRIEIVDGAARLTLYGTDAETNFGHRTEVSFPAFPNSGECWSSLDFMIDPLWTTNGVSGLGSWYPTPDAGEQLLVKHVNIGLRIVDQETLFVAVPATTLPAVTSIGRIVAARKVEKGKWYNVTIRANLQTNATGWREVYLDRMKIFGEYNVPTAYEDANGPYFKVGPRTLSQDYDMVRMWVRNVKQWTGNESFPAVMGEVPVSPLRMLRQ
jgi:hypothetical protein